MTDTPAPTEAQTDQPDPHEPPEARTLRLMLEKPAGALKAVELFSLAALRLEDLQHPKNPPDVREAANAAQTILERICHAILMPRRHGAVVVAARPQLVVLKKDPT